MSICRTGPGTAGPPPTCVLRCCHARTGAGGIKPLTDRDWREIAATAAKVLGIERYPNATYSAARFEPDGLGGGVASGTLTLHGQTGPLELQVSSTGEDRYRVTASVLQSAFGIKPYTAFFGALKVRDAVDIEADIDLSA
ncbi:MAG: YceI family protein [Sporichthyaceae bacterium]|nr:YceI family protein [Sporichthyaceae bacterium]